MENELWDKLEKFVGTPLVSFAIPHYVNEIENQLSPEQIEPLGDLHHSLTEMFSTKKDEPAKFYIEGLIDLAKRGVIKKKN